MLLGMQRHAPLLVLCLLAPGCDRGEVPAAASGRIELVDVAAEAGLTLVQVSGDLRRWYIPESNGTGAAWLDHDGDGDLDVFIGNGAELVYHDGGKRLEVVRSARTALYRNDGKLRFTDVSEATGCARTDWTQALAVGDVDNDGDPDLFLGCFGPDVLLINTGGRFEERTAQSGLASDLWAAGAAFGDADNDGDLDLYVANYVQFDPERPPLEGKRNMIQGIEVGWGPVTENKQGFNVGAPDRFYRGDGKGGFREATREAGFELETALCSYAAVFTDVDGDGWQDVLVANDMEPCNLFRNRGDGTFVEEGLQRGFALDGRGKATSAMGLVVEDFDRDGWLDVFRTNFDFEPNGLHKNDGRGQYAERAQRLGLGDASFARLGWGAGCLDVDLDGDLDLMVANGHVYPQAAEIGMNGWLQQSQLFEAVQDPAGATVFVDATLRAGAGLAPLRSSRGLALADADDDGDVDALLIDMDGPPRLLENRSERRGRWISVRAQGSASNRDGYGCKVRVRAGGRTWLRELHPGRGLYSSHDPRLHFGLGAVAAVDEVEVQWPSGRRSLVKAPPLDKLLLVREPEEPVR